VSRRGPIIAGAACVVLAVLGVVLLVLPKMNEVTAKEDQLAAAEDQEGTLQAELGRLEDARAEAPEAEAEIRELETLVPPTEDLPGMIRLLSGAADRAGVEFFSVAPGAPAGDESGEFSIITTGVTVNGEFFSLDEFAYRLETLPRAAKVMNISISRGGGEEGSDTGGLSMQLTLELYTTDPSAGPGSDPAPGESYFASAPTTGA